MKSAIKGINAGYSYKDILAVDNVSFSVGQGLLVAIAGPNGSGKTTLLKMIAGLVKPGSGEVSLFGRDLRSMTRKEIARRLAWVPQSPEPVFGYRVKNLVMMGRSPHQGFLGFESIDDRRIAKEAMGQTDILNFKDRFLTDLSGGELQRAFIARALCQSHEVLLLDEPTSSLDPAHQIQIMNVLRDLCKNRNSTVIMVSHDLNLCSMYADRLMLMKNGRIADFGPPETVLNPSMLESVYGCKLSVELHSELGFAVVVPVPDF
ncbi:ABC transporter ATP-binding protein [Desulforegula conservatrix]|uniref:ABC transporter ATP-binding protein n=1 Tax=Desulforegula conservatrix TaxID=153026 RepID=UPI00041418A5|nr:ABC transporter ATP-binding protein [Desulforegula conservatrix]